MRVIVQYCIVGISPRRSAAIEMGVAGWAHRSISRIRSYPIRMYRICGKVAGKCVLVSS
jgi:hypothetical protein